MNMMPAGPLAVEREPAGHQSSLVVFLVTRILLVSAVQSILLWQREEIPGIIPLTCLEDTGGEAHLAVGILRYRHLTDGLQIVGSLLPTAQVVEAVTLEGELYEALVLILLLEGIEREVRSDVGLSGALANHIDGLCSS